MKNRFTALKILTIAVAIVILLTETEQAFSGAATGLDLCIKTVIPSLLPLFVLSHLFANALLQTKNKFLTPFGKLCTIPEGQEMLLLLGFICGYPVGALNVYRCYTNGRISRNTANHMLSFCSNAGPSFIFGITSVLFSSTIIPWILWGIQIISAVLTGILLPGEIAKSKESPCTPQISLQEALTISLKSLAIVCGWVILFRTIITILDHWVLNTLPSSISITIIGLLELTNGCTALKYIHDEAFRFVLCSAFLSFGGLCVLMQTLSVTKELGIKSYLNGKIMQSSISMLIAIITQPIIFSTNNNTEKICIPFILSLIVIICSIYFSRKKK